MKKFANVICILMVMAFAAGCTKSVGPNRKSDALKRAKEYVLGKYGEEFEDAGDIISSCGLDEKPSLSCHFSAPFLPSYP